ncbi:MAG: amidase [Acidobacteria bacterium]|jgi:Asp-tRNA(Asn)/Glu-tRNA(Gln) amidotransferase A subunit family amidase|nr:amidase [Acidobacteriota bacterium]
MGKKTVSRLILYSTIFFIFLIGFNAYLPSEEKSAQEKNITKEDIKIAAKTIGIDFSDKEIELMEPDVKENLESYLTLRKYTLDNGTSPAIYFNPLVPDLKIEIKDSPKVEYQLPVIKAPAKIEDLAFAPVTVLASLIKSRQITSVQLTEMYLKRLQQYGPKLHCVITLTEDLAMAQARKADQEIAVGHYRGPLHGIPWGAKDLLATKGIKTTWGSPPYKDQVPDINATVVKRLEEAGAVLAAKLSVGELAWGDVWTGGKTRNPWDIEQGSSGSSAGPASATAAGLVGFAIGTETWGSIVSPSTRCGVTGFRPTFGRVSRYGCMALSWTMDKIGPICRSVEDCALVFDAIYGADGKDLVVRDFPFTWNPAVDIKTLRIGYLAKEFAKDSPTKKYDTAVLDTLRALGVTLIPVELPDFPVSSLSFILSAEAAAAFDDLTRSGKDDLMVRQEREAWPNVFRHSRLIPAVEYIQANRFRVELMQKMVQIFKDIDVYISPTFGGDNLLLTNLTGHPCVVVPNGFDEKNHPVSITFIGNLFDEAKPLAVAKVYQDVTQFHLKHPEL